MLITIDGEQKDYGDVNSPEYMTKSQIFSYDFCPIQYFKQYILKEKQKPTYQMVLGTRIHDYFDTFFKHIDEIPTSLWQETIPQNFAENEKHMCLNFLCKEDERYATLDYEHFVPFANELWCQSENLKIRGYIDRIDWINKDENELMIVEYKTGNTFKDVQLRQELAFYSIMFNDVTENQYNVTHTSCFNPKLNRYEEWEIKKRDIVNATKKWDKLKNAVDTMTFNSKCSDFKLQVCGRCERK